MKYILISLLSISVLVSSAMAAEEKRDPLHYEDNDIMLRIVPRTQESIIAFYQGRGFPRAAVDVIKNTCYITILMRNKSKEIHWLELDNWRFESKNKTFKRLTRDYWKMKWRDMGIPQSYQSTFGWSLLPEVRDLHPDEPVGGNTTFVRVADPISIEARFKLGKDKRGGEKVVRFDGVRCKQ